MKERIGKSFGFLKTTALGGLFFLLPLVVIGALLGYVYSIVSVIYEPLKEWIPVSTTAGLAALFAIAVGILLLLCFIAGIIARRAIGRKFAKTVEKQLMTVFPKYAVYKDLLADNIGGPENVPSLRPVCMRHGDQLSTGLRGRSPGQRPGRRVHAGSARHVDRRTSNWSPPTALNRSTSPSRSSWGSSNGWAAIPPTMLKEIKLPALA